MPTLVATNSRIWWHPSPPLPVSMHDVSSPAVGGNDPFTTSRGRVNRTTSPPLEAEIPELVSSSPGNSSGSSYSEYQHQTQFLHVLSNNHFTHEATMSQTHPTHSFALSTSPTKNHVSDSFHDMHSYALSNDASTSTVHAATASTLMHHTPIAALYSTSPSVVKPNKLRKSRVLSDSSPTDTSDLSFVVDNASHLSASNFPYQFRPESESSPIRARLESPKRRKSLLSSLSFKRRRPQLQASPAPSISIASAPNSQSAIQLPLMQRAETTLHSSVNTLPSISQGQASDFSRTGASTGRKLKKKRPSFTHVEFEDMTPTILLDAPSPTERPRLSSGTRSRSHSLISKWKASRDDRPLPPLPPLPPPRSSDTLRSNLPRLETEPTKHMSDNQQPLRSAFRRSLSWHHTFGSMQQEKNDQILMRSNARPSAVITPALQPKKAKMFTLGDADDHDHDHDHDEDAVLFDSPMSSNAHPRTVSFSRPKITRRDAEGTSENTDWRRWTLATAMTDEGMTDEVFVGELEKIRRAGSVDDSHRDVDKQMVVQAASVLVPIDPYFNWGRTRRASTNTTNYVDTFGEIAAQEATWPKALRALLTTRDLLRTERNYLKSLTVLLRSCPFGTDVPRDLLHLVETPEAGKLPWPRNPPVGVMLVHLAALIRISAGLMTSMQEDPSAGGVATAFLLAAGQMEDAFVCWCSSVGTWYTREGDENLGKRTTRRLSKSRFSPPEEKELPPPPLPSRSDSVASDLHSPPVSRSAPSSWRRSMPSLPHLTSSDTSHSNISAPSPIFSSRQKHREYKAKVLSVRELGMMPVQRVMRYALLFKDLLKHTPTSSPSRGVVSKAVEVAERLAKRCDDVQGSIKFTNAFS